MTQPRPHQPNTTHTESLDTVGMDTVGMDTVSGRFRYFAAEFAAKVQRVPPDLWHAPTPCPGWDVAELVAHVVEMTGVHIRLVGERLPSGPSVHDDPVGAFRRVHDAVQAMLADPVLASAEFEGRFGRWTFAQAVDRAICLDLAIHGWDLARATGQDETLEPAVVGHLWDVVRQVGDAAIRYGFGAPQPPPPGADDATRLLAYLGRVR